MTVLYYNPKTPVRRVMDTTGILANVRAAEEEEDPRRAVQQLCQIIRMIVEGYERDEEYRQELQAGDDY